jgi:hypothetical protein
MGQPVKKMQQLAAAFVLALGGVVSGLGGVPLAHAAATLTWTGAAGDNLFSSATNWSTGSAPTAGDSIVFNNVSLSSQETITNDMTSLSLAGVAFSGVNAQYYSYTIAGNALTVGGAISGEGKLTTNLTLASDTTLSKTTLGDSSGSTTLNTAGHMLTINDSGVCGGSVDSALIGSGNVVVSLATDKGYNFTKASPSFTGQFSVTSGAAGFDSTAALGAASGLVVNGGSAVIGLNGANRSLPVLVSVGGSGSQYYAPLTVFHDNGRVAGCAGGGGSPSENLTLTLAGGLNLLSDAVYQGYYANTVVSNPYSANGHNLTVKSSSIGTITLPDSTVIAPQPTTTNYSANAPAQDITVNANETAVVSGTYHNVSVQDKGTLKGAGTVDSLYAWGGSTVAPGNSPGTINVVNNLQLDIGSTLQEEIQNTSAYDKIVVTNGPVAINDATLNTSLYTGYSIKAGDSFTIIDNQGSGAVTGTFQGLAQGAQFTVDGVTFSITYTGGTGNDVVLTALTSGSAPATPNTGFMLQLKNPVIVAFLGLLSAAVCVVMMKRTAKR